tara:strand:+ start:1283 stop:2068 length:786 start_codon:yes stop_codon:yes gene_type:complete
MRIFTFGCSYTKYYWPTWADILRHSLGNDVVFNYAHQGTGPSQIMYNMQIANAKHNFNPATDKIIIQWTQWSREDRYINGKWTADGGIPNQLFDNTWMKKFHDVDYDFIRALTIIKTINSAYSNLIKYQYHWNLHEGINNPNMLSSPLQQYLASVYKEGFPGINDVYTSHPTYPNIGDGHPTVYGHLEQAIKIADAIGVDISENSKKVFIDLDAENMKLVSNHKTIKRWFKSYRHLPVSDGLNAELRDPDLENKKLWAIND